MAQTPRPADVVRVGQVFLGKYQVEGIVGQGGMGVVAECTHLALNERVALKMLRQDVLLDRDAVERFMREAQAAVKLKSEYVARVTDVGALENGTPYMVMEFLDGQDLGQLIGERKHLNVGWATELMLQACEGLAEAHSLGIVHRDVKPTNLFVTWRPDGSSLIKVLDFGISKAPMGTDMHLTQTQSLLGTPAYMSPEQMRSARNVDQRTDIWSLGTVMYELIEGRKPFEAESFSEMCVKVAVDPPAPMRNAPPELAEVILRCLAKNPDQRYASMGDLARDLIPFANDPQQATMLVERMQRLQRRSMGNEWDVSTGVGMRSVPHYVRDGGSSPVRSQFAGGSEPAAARFQGGTDPNASPFRGGTDSAGQPYRHTPVPQPMAKLASGAIPLKVGREPSSPAASPSGYYEAPKRRGKALLVALGALLVGAITVGIALGLAKDDETAPRATAGETTTRDSITPTTSGTQPTEPVTPPVTNPNVPTTTDTNPAATAGTETIGDKPVDPTITTTGDKPVETTATTTDKTVKATTKTGKTGKTGTKSGIKKVEPKAETLPKVEVKAAKPCNPFDNPHGCPKTP